VDASGPHAHMHYRTVNETLKAIGATTQPRVLVLNKVDRIRSSADLAVWLNREPDAIALSAVTGEGVDDLRRAVLKQFLGEVRTVNVALPMNDTRSIMFLEKRARVLDRQYRDATAVFKVMIGRRQVDQLLANRGVGARMTIDDLPPHEALETIWSNGRAAPEPRMPPHQQHWHAPEAS
jgi:GTPase